MLGEGRPGDRDEGVHGVRQHAEVVALTLAVLVSLCGSPCAHAHGTDPDIVSLRYAVGDEGVRLELLVAPAVFEVWFALERADLLAFTADEDRRARAAVQAYLSSACPVHVDGARAAPVVEQLSVVQRPFRDRQMDYILTEVHYPAREPRTVRVAWERFVVVDVELDGIHLELSDGRRTVPVLVTPAEPEVTWHAPTPARLVTRLPAEPRVVDRARPWLLGALGLLAVTAVLAVALRALGGRRPVVYVAVLVGVGLAGALAHRGWQEHERPRGPPLPDGARARVLVEALLEGVYDAFAYDAEEQVYDALASVVAGELLDGLYLEVHRSLVTAEAGGAVASVRELVVEEAALAGGAGDRFAVDCRWRVRGEVVHWGHAHGRVVRYDARLGVRWTAGGWRLASIDVREVGEPANADPR